MTWMSWVLGCALSLSIGCARRDDGPGEDTQGEDTQGEGEEASGSFIAGPIGSESGGDTSGGAEASGASEGSGSDADTGPDLPPGTCYDADHDGAYPCECSEGETRSCADGVQVCIIDDQEVYTASYWSDCLECAPGSAQACTTAEGGAGTQYCDVQSIAELDAEWGASWGVCLDPDAIVCDPTTHEGCELPARCRLDADGIPGCTE